MKTQEQIDLEKSILESANKNRELLKDSPRSLQSVLSHLQGYYLGFCRAKYWNEDLDFLNQIA